MYLVDFRDCGMAHTTFELRAFKKMGPHFYVYLQSVVSFSVYAIDVKLRRMQ